MGTEYISEREICEDTSEGENRYDTYDDHQPGANIEARLSAFKNEPARFFQETRWIWDELASWDDDLKINKITIFVYGASFYKLLGPEFRDRGLVQKYLLLDAWLHVYKGRQLPVIPSISNLIVHDWDQSILMWLPVVACQIAHLTEHHTFRHLRHRLSEDVETRQKRISAQFVLGLDF